MKTVHIHALSFSKPPPEARIPTQFNRRYNRSCSAFGSHSHHRLCRYNNNPRQSTTRSAHRSPIIILASSSSPDPYQVLGVPRAATVNEIKKAYRKKALRLHPDVNKAPDARERFMECKVAYQELLQISERRSKGGTSGGFSGSNPFSSSWKSSSSRGSGTDNDNTRSRRSPQQQEEFYGLDELINGMKDEASKIIDQLGDLFRDLGKEWDEYSNQKQGQSTGPKSLWEELADIGEELVEYLEKGINIDQTVNTTTDNNNTSNNSGSSNSSSSSNSNSKDSVGGSYGSSSQYNNSAYDAVRKNNPPSSTRVSPGGSQQKSRKEVIDDELDALKRKMGLK